MKNIRRAADARSIDPAQREKKHWQKLFLYKKPGKYMAEALYSCMREIEKAMKSELGVRKVEAESLAKMTRKLNQGKQAYIGGYGDSKWILNAGLNGIELLSNKGGVRTEHKKWGWFEFMDRAKSGRLFKGLLDGASSSGLSALLEWANKWVQQTYKAKDPYGQQKVSEGPGGIGYNLVLPEKDGLTVKVDLISYKDGYLEARIFGKNPSGSFDEMAESVVVKDDLGNTRDFTSQFTSALRDIFSEYQATQTPSQKSRDLMGEAISYVKSTLKGTVTQTEAGGKVKFKLPPEEGAERWLTLNPFDRSTDMNDIIDVYVEMYNYGLGVKASGGLAVKKTKGMSGVRVGIQKSLASAEKDFRQQMNDLPTGHKLADVLYGHLEQKYRSTLSISKAQNRGQTTGNANFSLGDIAIEMNWVGTDDKISVDLSFELDGETASDSISVSATANAATTLLKSVQRSLNLKTSEVKRKAEAKQEAQRAQQAGPDIDAMLAIVNRWCRYQSSSTRHLEDARYSSEYARIDAEFKDAEFEAQDDFDPWDEDGNDNLDYDYEVEEFTKRKEADLLDDLKDHKQYIDYVSVVQGDSDWWEVTVKLK